MKTYTVRVDDSGTTRWCKEGTDLLHREDDLPAVEYENGDKLWFFNGVFHRENGPAAIYMNGIKSWVLDGYNFSEANFNAEIARRKASKTPNCDGKFVEIDGKKYQLKEVK